MFKDNLLKNKTIVVTGGVADLAKPSQNSANNRAHIRCSNGLGHQSTELDASRFCILICCGGGFGSLLRGAKKLKADCDFPTSVCCPDMFVAHHDLLGAKQQRGTSGRQSGCYSTGHFGDSSSRPMLRDTAGDINGPLDDECRRVVLELAGYY